MITSLRRKTTPASHYLRGLGAPIRAAHHVESCIDSSIPAQIQSSPQKSSSRPSVRRRAWQSASGESSHARDGRRLYELHVGLPHTVALVVGSSVAACVLRVQPSALSVQMVGAAWKDTHGMRGPLPVDPQVSGPLLGGMYTPSWVRRTTGKPTMVTVPGTRWSTRKRYDSSASPAAYLLSRQQTRARVMAAKPKAISPQGRAPTQQSVRGEVEEYGSRRTVRVRPARATAPLGVQGGPYEQASSPIPFVLWDDNGRGGLPTNDLTDPGNPGLVKSCLSVSDGAQHHTLSLDNEGQVEGVRLNCA